MATNLVELTKSYFTPELVQKVSALVGESPPATQKAIEGAIPGEWPGFAQAASAISGSARGTASARGNRCPRLTNCWVSHSLQS
jgi:hypothetical protein